MKDKFWIGTNSEIFSLWIHARINLYRQIATEGCTCSDQNKIREYKNILGSMTSGWLFNKYDVQYCIFVEELTKSIN